MENCIHLADCLELLSKVAGESVRLVVADPPYFLLNRNWDRKQWNSLEDYLQWCRKWFNECHRVLAKDGSIYVFQDWRLAAEFVAELRKVFPHFRNWITWERNKGRSSKSNFKSSKEEILYFSKSRNPVFNEQRKLRPVIAPYRDEEGRPKGWFCDENGNRVRWTGVGNVWHYTPPVWSSKDDCPVHPTQKPLMMMERIVTSSSNEGDLVLDLFSGSGTTSLACKRLKRRYVGVENNEEFWLLANRRLNDK